MTHPEPEPGPEQPQQPHPASSWPPPPPTGYQPYPQPHPATSWPPSPPTGYEPYLQPQPVYTVPSPVPQPPVTNTGPVGFAFGVLALMLGWIPLFGVAGIACGVVGLALCMKALRLAKHGFISDRGLAIAGVVCACAGLVLGLAINLTLLIALTAAG